MPGAKLTTREWGTGTPRTGRGRRGGLTGCGLLLATLVGCGGSTPVPVFPVEGVVEVAGQPAAGAFVVFHPVGSRPRDASGAEVPLPSAQVKADGKFQLTTFEASDGAPAGRYAVTVQWHKLVGKGNDQQAGPNVVPPQYSDPASSPVQVSVESKPNQLEPIQIQLRGSDRGKPTRR